VRGFTSGRRAPQRETAHDAAWRTAVALRSGSVPAIQYFELQMLLDKEVGTVTEWSNSGEKLVRQIL